MLDLHKQMDNRIKLLEEILSFRMQGVEFDNGDMYVDGHKAASDVRDEFVSVTEKLMDELAQCYNVLPQLDINNTIDHRPEGDEKWFLVFFSSGRRHTRYWRDWSSDVCSSDLIGAHDDPRRVFMVRAREHRVTCATVVTPVALGRVVDGTDLPLLERIAPAAAQPTRLLVTADIEIVLEKNDVRARQHPFEAWRGFQERLVFFACAKLHDEFDARPVVPTAVEENDFPRG